MMKLGVKIRKLRKAKKMSQGALAKKAKVSREYVNKLEAGRYDPTVGTLKRLAKVLKVRLTQLLE